MASLFDWSATPASNVTLDSINVNTGMSPANVDNSLRSLMALVRNSFASALQTFLAGTAALPLANGGTGGTDAPTARTALGALSSVYRDLVPITKTAAFTFADADRGGSIFYSGAAAIATIDPEATTAITYGAVYLIYNGGTGALTVTPGAGVTLRVNGAIVSASATIAIGGQATLIKLGANYWTIVGAGVS